MKILFAGFFALCLAGSSMAMADTTVCLTCHAAPQMKAELRKIPGVWKQSWHAQNSIACNDCHGGDPKDADMAMSPQRGFVGAPTYQAVPEFCGKCHSGILKNYLASGHGMALKASGKGPNCVTCHGSHEVQKASLDIINEKRCTQCHSYDRAKVMKQALFLTETRLTKVDHDLGKLRDQGIYTENEGKVLFRTQAEFRTLFHTVDVPLVQKKSDGFIRQLDSLQKTVDDLFAEIHFRKTFSACLLLLFSALTIVSFMLAKTYEHSPD